MKNIYEDFMGDDYVVQRQMLLKYLRSGVIADIGANNGSQIIEMAANVLDCTFLAVEPDTAMLSALQSATLNSGTLQIFNEGAESFLSRTDLPICTTIYSGATLHEIHKANRQLGPREVVRRVLLGCKNHMEKGSRLIISDRYYHISATQDEIKESMAAQLKAIGHADEPWTFIPSDFLRELAEELGFTFLAGQEHISPAIALRYYYCQAYQL